MPDETVIDLFAEDFAHEAFVSSMIRRLARERGMPVHVRVISARGGHPKVLEELRIYRNSIDKGLLERLPDVIVIASDANCSTYNVARQRIEDVAGAGVMAHAVVACPDPHVERWYMADPASFSEVVGMQVRPGKKKCDRGQYKDALARAVRAGGHPTTLGGVEFGTDLVEAMDVYRGGKNEKSLKHFVDGLRAQLARVAEGQE